MKLDHKRAKSQQLEFQKSAIAKEKQCDQRRAKAREAVEQQTEPVHRSEEDKEGKEKRLK